MRELQERLASSSLSLPLSVQLFILCREQRHIEQTTMLKEEIRKLERDRSRETENLEYLKNVVVHYMSADSTGRDQLLMPLATVLHLSPEEVGILL